MSDGGLTAHIVAKRDGFSLDAALDVAAGETVALLGPNGAGKSTALEALMGWQRLQSGSIELGGQPLDDPARDVFVPPEAREIGVAFQDNLLFPHLTALDNVAFGLVSRGQTKPGARALVGPLIESLGLTSVAGQRATELSGGQAQRVALARALAIKPKLLLLDEPMAALDVSTRTSTRRLLREHLADVGVPTVLVTHDPADANVLADRIVVLEAGRVTQVGTPEAIRRRPRSNYAADLVGINLLAGTVADGTIQIDDSELVLSTSDRSASGQIVATIHPRAVALHRERPDGSPRNAWLAVVDSVEPVGETTRVQLASPLPLTADITPGAAADLALGPGSQIWVAVKATEISVSNL